MYPKIKFLGIVLASMTAAAAAQDATYLNFWYDNDGNVSVSQDTEDKCLGAPNCESQQLSSLSETAGALDALLKANWMDVAGGSFTLKSDLDMGQIGDNGKCKVNHVPFTFAVQTNGMLVGNNKVVKNLCYSTEIDGVSALSDTKKRMSAVGFFSKLKNVEVKGISFENVRFSVTASTLSESSDKQSICFSTMGALAGSVENSKISGVDLKEISISGPAVGGVAGASMGGSFDKITSHDAIMLSNQVKLEKKNAVPTNIPWGGLYSVFLGGVVSHAVNTNFSMVDISVNIQNDSKSTSSALGGIAGLYAISDSANTEGLTTLTIDSVVVGQNVVASMQWGKGMGGLFGEVAPYNQKDATGLNLSIERSFFNGSLKNSVSSDPGVGGFIGRATRDQSNQKFLISISRGRSNIVINEKFDGTMTGTSYFAGGFLGYGNDATADIKNQPLSIKGSKVSGEIKVSGDNTEKSLKVVVGGLAGYAYFADNGNAIINDTSLVAIDVDVVTTDSVLAGGFVGRAEIPDRVVSTLDVDNSMYNGGITVSKNRGGSYIGGAIGIVRKGENGNHTRFNKVQILGGKLISLKGGVVDPVESKNAYVGGLCGYCRTLSTLNLSSVEGDIEVLGNLNDSLYVGGFVGNASNSTMPFVMENNRFIGDIVLDDEVKKSKVLAGYMYGYARITANAHHSLASNFHVGADALEAFGNFYYGSNGNSNPWGISKLTVCSDENTPPATQYCWNAKGNIRNGAETSLDTRDNGLMDEASVKQQDLAKKLNEASGQDVWVFQGGLYPYLKDIGSSSVAPESSSSEVQSSSSAGAQSSSSAAQQSSSSSEVQSSSSVEPEISSSSEKREESSSSAEVLRFDSGSWKMASLKGLEEVGFKTSSKAYWWDESTSVGEYWQYQAYDPNDIGSANKGYWIWNSKAVEKELPLVVPSENAKIVWDVDSVYTGWNLVANPYGWAVSLECDALRDVEVWHLSDTGYVESPKYLRPYEGAWVRATSATKGRIEFDAKLAGSPVLEKRAFAKSSGWSMTLSLTDHRGQTDSWNVVGTNNVEVLSDEPPTNMGNHVGLAIMESGRALAKSLKLESQKMEWDVSLEASTIRNGWLKLSGIDQVNALGKKVLVTIDGETTEMKPGDSVRVILAPTAKLAKLTVVNNSKPAVQNLGKILVARSEGLINVRFNVAGNLVGCDAQVDLVTVSGKKIGSTHLVTSAGSNSIDMDVPDRGMYMLRVQVGSQVYGQKVLIK